MSSTDLPSARRAKPVRSSAPWSLAEAGLSLVAGALFVFRAVRTATGDGLSDGGSPAGVALASLAAVLCLVAAVMAVRGLPRLAAVPLVAALLLELFLLDRYVAPPRLVTAIPLVFALALALVRPTSPAGVRTAGRSANARKLATVVALALMVPVGFLYISTGLVAPAPDLFGAYALFAVLVAVTVLLARRRSWWVVAMPVVSAGVWFLMLWFGEAYLDWSP